jgi:hypothetical protein
MLATSIDGVEHSDILKGVMAGSQIDTQMPQRCPTDDDTSRSPDWHSDRDPECTSDGPARCPDRVLHTRPHDARRGHRYRQPKPWCERPIFSRAGPSRAADTGVVHTTACSQSPTPWRAHGRQTAPPDRGDPADKSLSELLMALRALTVSRCLLLIDSRSRGNSSGQPTWSVGCLPR